MVKFLDGEDAPVHWGRCPCPTLPMIEVDYALLSPWASVKCDSFHHPSSQCRSSIVLCLIALVGKVG